MVYNMNAYHTSVLLKEVINGLAECFGARECPEKIVVDATAGGMGHSAALATELSKNDRILIIDKDFDAINNNKDQVATKAKTIFIHDGFENLAKILKENNIDKVDFVLADLGVSSHQIDTASRGFSYMNDGPLDMRMDVNGKRDAYHVVNHYSKERLQEIIKEYGEERHARSISEAIIKHRPINSTGELSKVIVGATPGSYFKTGGHPAKRTFQAIRIEVNRELENLETFLNAAIQALKIGGRIAVITFHSLEDRIVKQTFKHHEAACLCPPKSPKCICGKTASLKIVTKKPIIPTKEEQKENPRSTSAKLRIGEKI